MSARDAARLGLLMLAEGSGMALKSYHRPGPKTFLSRSARKYAAHYDPVPMMNGTNTQY